MYRGGKSRCLQPLAIFCPLTSANLRESPTVFKETSSTVHASDLRDMAMR